MIVELKQARADELRRKIDVNIMLLELSLTIFLIQSLVAKSSPKLNQIDRPIFFREINNEVVRSLTGPYLPPTFNLDFSFRTEHFQVEPVVEASSETELG